MSRRRIHAVDYPDQIKSTNVGLENVGHQNGEMKNPLDLANDVLMQKLLPDCLRNLLEIKDSNSELFKRFESHFKSAVRLELRHFWSDLIQELMVSEQSILPLHLFILDSIPIKENFKRSRS